MKRLLFPKTFIDHVTIHHSLPARNQRNWQPFNFLIKQGLSPNIARRLLNGKVAHLKLDHISTLCRSLHCTSNDLLEWVEDHDAALPENHPQQSLVREQVPLTIRGNCRNRRFTSWKKSGRRSRSWEKQTTEHRARWLTSGVIFAGHQRIGLRENGSGGVLWAKKSGV